MEDKTDFSISQYQYQYTYQYYQYQKLKQKYLFKIKRSSQKIISETKIKIEGKVQLELEDQ